MSSARASFLAGLKGVTPILIGVIPFGMIYGVVALEAGLTAVQAQAMSLIVFAGSAQFVMAQLFDVQAAAVVIIVTGVLVNLRHMLYSATIASYFNHLSSKWHLFLAYFLTDEAFAVSITRFQKGVSPYRTRFYYLGAGIGLWLTWQLSTAAGILAGSRIPGEWSLDYFLTLTFIALVVPSLNDRSGLIAALTAGTISVAALNLPYGFGLILATLIGVGAGLAAERVLPLRSVPGNYEG